MQQNITLEELKSQSKCIRDSLRSSGYDVSLSYVLEVCAKAQGFKDWNTASALLKRADEFRKTIPLPSPRENPAVDPARSSNAASPTHGANTTFFGGSFEIPPKSSTVGVIVPELSPYFEIRSVRLIGWSKKNPHLMRRFVVGHIGVGGTSQMGMRPRGAEEPALGLISDVFSVGGRPLKVNWSVISTSELARELSIHAFNMNNEVIVASWALWGVPVTSLDVYR